MKAGRIFPIEHKLALAAVSQQIAIISYFYMHLRYREEAVEG